MGLPTTQFRVEPPTHPQPQATASSRRGSKECITPIKRSIYLSIKEKKTKLFKKKKEKKKKFWSLVLQHPLHYVFPNHPLRPSHPKTRSHHPFGIPEGHLPVLGRPAGKRRGSHHHRDGRERLVPHESRRRRKQMPVGFFLIEARFWGDGFLVLSIAYLLCHATACSASYIRFFYRTADLGRRFHAVQASEDPVTEAPANFDVSFLNVSVNL